MHHLSLEVNRKLASPALLVLIVTGIYQAIDGDSRSDEPWIGATFVIVIVLGGLQGGYFIADRPQARGDGREGAGQRARPTLRTTISARRSARAASARSPGFLIVVAVFLMVTKPGA